MLNVQKKLLKDEGRKAKAYLVQLMKKVDESRYRFNNKTDKNWLPS